MTDLNLTERQLEIFRLLGEGKRQTEVADDLDVTPQTIQTHVSRALLASGAKTRVELAVRVALADRGIDLDLTETRNK